MLDMQFNSSLKDDKQGEPSLVVKPYIGDKKEQIDEAIITCLGRWESHFKLHPKLDHTKICYASRELGGKATTWCCGLHNAQKLPSAWDNCVDLFTKTFL